MNPSLDNAWPEADLAKLKQLWLEGLSITEICQSLCRRKGQVSGKINRIRDELGYRSARAVQRNHGRFMARLHRERVARITECAA